MALAAVVILLAGLAASSAGIGLGGASHPTAMAPSFVLGANVPGPLVANATIRDAGSTWVAPAIVPFEAHPSGGTPPYATVWNFGDGSPPASTPTPSHRFAIVGQYLVLLSVSDAMGRSATNTFTIVITSGSSGSSSSSFAPGATELPPAAWPVLGRAPLDVTYASPSPPAAAWPPASIAYRWSFGDGATGSNGSGTHRFLTPGVYALSLTESIRWNATSNVTPTLWNDSSIVTVVVGGPSTPFTAAINASFASYTLSCSQGVGFRERFVPIHLGGSPPLSYSWGFSDGSFSGPNDNSSPGAAIHQFASTTGAFATLTVVGSDGSVAMASMAGLTSQGSGIVFAPPAPLYALGGPACPPPPPTFDLFGALGSSAGPFALIVGVIAAVVAVTTIAALRPGSRPRGGWSFPIPPRSPPDVPSPSDRQT